MIYDIPGHRRSTLICNSMAHGFDALGIKYFRKDQASYSSPEADVAVFYGFISNLPKIMADYSVGGRAAVYIDLGYWGRHFGGRWTGYHKISVNARHPTAYFRGREHPGDRLKAVRIRPRPWVVAGKHILVAGMSDKGAIAEGYRPGQWENETIEELRRHTDRPIIYRPKPSWREATPIPGTTFSTRAVIIESVLPKCHAVVTHHSNAAVDGIVHGVPAFCWLGVAETMSLQKMEMIEKPYRPEGRSEWMADIAYTQWNIVEMRNGAAWRYLLDEGLVQ